MSRRLVPAGVAGKRGKGGNPGMKKPRQPAGRCRTRRAGLCDVQGPAMRKGN